MSRSSRVAFDDADRTIVAALETRTFREEIGVSDATIAPGPPETGEVIVMLTLAFKPGTVDDVLAVVLPLIEPTRAEPGNDRFDVFRVTARPDTLVILERWKSKTALEEHWALPYTKRALAAFEANLIEPLVDGRNVVYLSATPAERSA